MEGRSQAGNSARFPWMKQWSGWKVNVGSARVFTAVLLLMALAGMGVVLAATRWGAGLTDESYFYGGWIVYRLTESRGAGIEGALLCLVAQVMAKAHSWAMREALYISMMFATIWAIDGYRAKEFLQAQTAVEEYSNSAAYQAQP